MMRFTLALLIFMGTVTFAHAESLIGVLQSRHHMVELHAADDSVLYTVKNRKGQILGDRLTDVQLLSEFPDLKSVVQGYADDASLGPDVRSDRAFDLDL